MNIVKVLLLLKIMCYYSVKFFSMEIIVNFIIVRKHTFDTVYYNHYCITTNECIFVSLTMLKNR